MKKIALVLLASVSFAAVNASSYDDRIYVPSRDVMVGDNGIFVNIEGTVFVAGQIGYDESGVFVYLSPKKACEKCRQEKMRKAEENRKKKQEFLDKQKQEQDAAKNQQPEQQPQQ